MSVKTRFIGDIHGGLDESVEWYLKTIQGCTQSIQVGDFGFGFIKDTSFLNSLSTRHKIIRGNHDNPEIAYKCLNVISDGFYMNGIFYLGGAYSIDQYKRVEGVDWWREEELSIKQLGHAICNYQYSTPKVVVSHDCPESVLPLLGIHKSQNESRTRQALQAMYEIHKPKLWVFGHWHQSIDQVIGNTRFVGLNKLEYKDIDLEVL
jgi:predicted phosphodiesterase